MAIYVVKKGDTLTSIAKKLQVPMEQISFSNQLVPPYQLAVGQALFILTKQEANQKKPWARTNVYAYPFISPWVLEQSLSYLTDLSVFSYGFTTEGDLRPPQVEDQWMIKAALDQGTNPLLTLTPFGPDDRFNNRLINAVVQNAGAQKNLINQVWQTVIEKGFQGVDIDFEYILAADRDAFTNFVKEMREVINVLGYPVSVTLEAKSSEEQQGLLYEGKDYKALGEVSDRVLFMTYEYGYKYGPPLPIAPINEVRKVVEYGLTVIPREKINLGIPNYGYDWPLPFEEGVTAARTIGNVEAVQIAIKQGAEIQFDEEAMSPYFRYTDQEVVHQVWFEDARSIQAKYDLVKEYSLEGVGYWQINGLFRASFELAQNNFRIVGKN